MKQKILIGLHFQYLLEILILLLMLQKNSYSANSLIHLFQLPINGLTIKVFICKIIILLLIYIFEIAIKTSSEMENNDYSQETNNECIF